MRSVAEWVGKSDDTAIPPRVKIRVFDATGGRCNECLRLITPGMGWQCDHIVALVNGGQNRETNLQPLCTLCHLHKTGRDVEVKAHTHAVRTKHLGLRKAKGRPMPGTKASGLRKRMDGRVERR
jgi:5-methylcytosine-specific restriction endonuclease McrA